MAAELRLIEGRAGGGQFTSARTRHDELRMESISAMDRLITEGQQVVAMAHRSAAAGEQLIAHATRSKAEMLHLTYGGFDDAA